jgi:hypothetical protein
VINKLLPISKIFTSDMEIILTEAQLNRILTEEKSNIISSILDKSDSAVKRIVKNVKNQYKLDFKFLSTYGAIIGGFAGPVEEYLRGLYPNLDEKDISLICFGIIMTFFSSNTEKLGKVLDLIKENGLRTYFDRALRKSYDLKDAFTEFLESLNVTFSSVGNAMAFAFIIPMVSVIYDITTQEGNVGLNVEMLIKSILSYKVLSASSETLSELFSKMIKRFRS